MGQAEQPEREGLAHSVLENLLEGCQVIGHDHRYLYVNAAAARHGRTTRQELVGRTMMEAYPGIERTPMFEALERCMTARTPGHVENAFTFPDGSMGWFELRFEPVPTGVALLSLDISERKRAEAALDRSRRALAVLTPCNQTLVRATDHGSFTEDICRAVVEEGGYLLAWIGLTDGDRPTPLVARAGRDDGYVNRDHAAWRDPAHGASCAAARAFRTAMPLVIQSVAADPDLAPLRQDAAERGFASCIALPIRNDGETLGVLTIYAGDPDAFDDAERSLLGEMATDLGYGLTALRGRVARDRAEAHVAQLNAVLRGIRSVNQRITRERDPQVLLQSACDLLVESRGFHAATIILCDEGRIAGSASAGLPQSVHALQTLIDDGELPDCVKLALEGGNVWVQPDSASFCGSCPAGLQGPQEAAAIRLKCDEKTFGALLVSFPPGFAAATEELDLLREVAGDVAFALRSIQLESQRDRSADEAREISDHLNAIVRASPAAIFALDADGSVRAWNSGSERLFGWTAQETLGHPLPIVPPQKRSEHEALRRRVLAGESFTELEVERLRKDGTMMWVSVSTAPLRDRDGNATGILAERILRSAGYEVLSASGGSDTLLLCENRGAAVDLLLTDVVMPQMSGRDLAEKLTALVPGLKVLYMSGYTDDAIVHHGVLDPGTRLLSKPFSAVDLASKVREALDDGKPSSR